MNKTKIVSAFAAGALALATLAGIAPFTSSAALAVDSPGDGPPSVQIIGGHKPSEDTPTEHMATLQLENRGDPNFHTCGAILGPGQRHITTAAHCVTRPPRDGKPMVVLPADTWHLRVGSQDRTSGGVVVGVTKVLVNPAWNFTPGTDWAVLELDQSVDLQPAEFAARVQVGKTTRLLGWGVINPNGTGPLPTHLQEIDSTQLPKSRCTFGDPLDITIGEVCIDNPNGTDGACFGDSGGPAMQKFAGRWQVVGLASRGPNPCGIHAAIYTDLSFHRKAIYAAARTGSVTPIKPAPPRDEIPPHKPKQSLMDWFGVVKHCEKSEC